MKHKLRLTTESKDVGLEERTVPAGERDVKNRIFSPISWIILVSELPKVSWLAFRLPPPIHPTSVYMHMYSARCLVADVALFKILIYILFVYDL